MIKIELNRFDAVMILEILTEFNSQILQGDYLVVSNAIGAICNKLREACEENE